MIQKKKIENYDNSIIFSIFVTESCYSDTKKEDRYGD